MKKFLLTLALGLCAFSLFAQECPFFPRSGKMLEYKATAALPTGVQYMISRQYIKNQNDDFTEIATEVYQEGGTGPLQTITLKYDNAGDAYKADFKEIFADNLSQLGDFEILESTGELIYPKKMEIGNRYPGVSMKIKATVYGMSMEMDISQEDRIVEARETVEVPAGKFECIRFSEKMIIKIMGQNQETVNTYWLSPGTGMIRQTTEAMNGMVKTTLELQSVTDRK